MKQWQIVLILSLIATSSLNIYSQTWSMLTAAGSPPATDGSSVVYDRTSDTVILFGGTTTQCCTNFNDVWLLSNASGVGGSPVWSKLPVTTPNGVPQVRSFQSAVYDAGQNIMTIFGGGQAASVGYFAPLFNDVWVLTNANGIGGPSIWIPVLPSGTPPAPREGHGAWLDTASNRMIVFGGGNNGIMDVPNDLWVLTNANGQGGSPAWEQLTPGGPLPLPVERFASGYDPTNNRLVMFGGCCYWNNSAWLLTTANGLGGTPVWAPLAPSGTVPEIREVHAYGYDPTLNELIVFGFGSVVSLYNDTWVLSSANGIGGTPSWTNIIPNNAPGSPPLPFLAADPGVYDPASARLMLEKSEDNGNGGIQVVPWVLALQPSPENLSAVVGDQRVILRWTIPQSMPQGYNIYADQMVNGSPFPLGLINASGPVQESHFLVSQLPRIGGPPQNGVVYRFRVTAVYASGESSPSLVLAQPNGFVAPPHPLHPILFLHGIDADGNTWQSTADFLSSTLHWTCGGTLSYRATDNPAKDRPRLNDPSLPQTCGTNQPFLKSGDYFTVNFGNKFANYPDDQGLYHQGDEVGGFIKELHEPSKLSIVAWSMGGLAARAYIQISDPISSPGQISDLITLGTPHFGVDRTYIKDFAKVFSPFLLLVFPDKVDALDSRGLFDMDGGCVSNGDSTDLTGLSQFLQSLDYNPTFSLPTGIRYAVVSGTGVNGYFYSGIDRCSLLNHLVTDLAVPTTSSTLAGILPSPQTWLSLSTKDIHTELPSDVSAILCTLDPNCLRLQVFSPVDIQVTAPSGNAIANGSTSMPGAEYSSVTDASGHEIANVLIPFPQGGQYMVTVTPKAGAQPTDTFTILQTQNGVTTTIAQDMQIQSIPPSGFQTTVNNGSSFMAVSPMSIDFGNVILGRRAKKVVTVTNPSATPVTIGSISFSVATGDPSQFSFDHVCPGRLMAGKSCTIGVIFTPDAAGSDAAMLNIVTSGSGIPLEVPITAAGTKKGR